MIPLKKLSSKGMILCFEIQMVILDCFSSLFYFACNTLMLSSLNEADTVYIKKLLNSTVKSVIFMTYKL